jgi:hypothetical protein
LEQNLLDKTKLDKYNDMITDNLNQIKSAEVEQALLNNLKKRYVTEYYYKGN